MYIHKNIRGQCVKSLYTKGTLIKRLRYFIKKNPGITFEWISRFKFGFYFSKSLIGSK